MKGYITCLLCSGPLLYTKFTLSLWRAKRNIHHFSEKVNGSFIPSLWTFCTPRSSFQYAPSSQENKSVDSSFVCVREEAKAGGCCPRGGCQSLWCAFITVFHLRWQWNHCGRCCNENRYFPFSWTGGIVPCITVFPSLVEEDMVVLTGVWKRPWKAGPVGLSAADFRICLGLWK